jgi:probable phosphoglycerate mutase
VSDSLFYLVRHAEPVLPDERRRFLGWADPPLSETGIDQAKRLAERLRAVHFDSVFSSDLRRCLQTAAIVGEALGLSSGEGACGIHADARLREIDLGRWDGLTAEEAAEQYPREYAERELDLVEYSFPGGESFRDLSARVVPAFLEIVEDAGKCALVVGHLGVNRVLLCHFLGRPLEELFSIGQDYGCVNLLKASGTRQGARRIEVLSYCHPTVR